MLIQVLAGATILELIIAIFLFKQRTIMLNERENYPGIFLKYKRKRNGKLSLVYSNDNTIKILDDIIPESYHIHCIEVFDEFMTSGVVEFTCQKDECTYNVNVKRFGKNTGFAIISDITSIKKMSDRAYTDALTGLPNRLAFNERVKSSISYALSNNMVMAVMFLDLDKFKAVNDTYGHEAGDILLKQVSQRLCEAVRGGDIVARLGGDEFIILLSHVAKVDFAYNIANRIISELTTPFDLNGITANIGTSIGIAIFPDHGTDAETIIKRADVGAR